MSSPRRSLAVASLGLGLSLAAPALGQQAAPPAGSAGAASSPAATTTAPGSVPPAAPGPTPPSAEAPRPSHTLGLEFAGGLSTRLNDSVTGLGFEERGGLSFHAGAFWAPSRLLSLGVHYTREGLGVENVTEREGGSGGRTQRRLDAIMLDLRLFPLRTNNVRLFVGLLGSLGFESVEKQGTVVDLATIQPVVYSFRCKASGSGGFGLGASLGVDLDVSDNSAFIIRSSAMSHRLPSSVLNDGDNPCAWGGGTTNMFEAQVGFQIRFDLGSSAPGPVRASGSASGS